MRPVRAAQRLGRKCSTAVESLFASSSARSFAKNERGNVAIMFGLSTFVVVGAVGGAVDFGRAYSLKAKLQQSLDAAALAAASTYVNDPNHDVEAASTHGSQFFNASMANVTGGAEMTLTLDPETETVRMTGSTTVKTPFLAIVPVLGVDSITMSAYSEATTTVSLSGGGSLAEVEVSLMLDITGSMDWDAGGGLTKIQALKNASKNFVDILLPATGTPKAKIALAPFAQRVFLGDQYIQIATGQPLTKQMTDVDVCGETCVNTTCRRYRSNGTCREWNQSCTTNTCTGYLSRCTTERTGTNAFTDAAPATGSYFPAKWYDNSTDANRCGTSDTSGPRTTIMPLSQDRTALKSHIDSMDTWGGTAGQLGTAWAWYMLSPSWSTVFTGDSAPKPLNTVSTAKNKKIAVLMTDGEYNTYYATGQGDSVQQARDLCDEMKVKEIEVFTVGFKLPNQTAIDTMNYCATDSSHAFLAENSEQLEAVFREIAYRAVPLHLAK